MDQIRPRKSEMKRLFVHIDLFMSFSLPRWSTESVTLTQVRDEKLSFLGEMIRERTQLVE